MKAKRFYREIKSQSSTSDDDNLDVEEKRLSDRNRKHKRDGSEKNRKPLSAKDKKFEKFLQIPNQQKKERSTRQGYQKQQDEFSQEESGFSMDQKPASPKRTKEQSRERGSRDRGEDDTARKVQPQKMTSGSNGNTIRGERIRKTGQLKDQDISATNSRDHDRGSSQNANNSLLAVPDKKRGRNQMLKNNAGDDEMFSGRESIDNHPTRTPLSPSRP